MSDVDVGSLYMERDQVYRQLQEYEALHAELDGKIERLKQAKKVIGDQQDAAYMMKGGQMCLMIANPWCGKTYTKYQEQVRSELTQQYNKYYDQLDEALDEVNLELMHLQNQCSDALGVMGNIQSAIHYLTTAIGNFFN